MLSFLIANFNVNFDCEGDLDEAGSPLKEKISPEIIKEYLDTETLTLEKRKDSYLLHVVESPIAIGIPISPSPPEHTVVEYKTNIQNEDCEVESSECSEYLDEIESLDPKKVDHKSTSNTMSTKSFRSFNTSVNRFARKEQRIVSQRNSDINSALNFSSN